ncbi:hypothetical protein [Sodalis-like endosymbiont of Proechinophthirus fluctus]|nr:hypothetical protein [Sodalis-like endosymbiont of Proechinophthirus fluctus]
MIVESLLDEGRMQTINHDELVVLGESFGVTPMAVVLYVESR